MAPYLAVHYALRDYLGLDLAASPRRPTAYALLDGQGALKEMGGVGDDEAILDLAQRLRPRLVAIDAPLSLPRGLCCLELSCPCCPLAPDGLKAAKRDLLRQGISLFPTTKRSIIKALAYRGVGLARALSSTGTAVVEVYPYASKVRLVCYPSHPGARPPKKRTVEGRAHLRRALEPLIPGLAAYTEPLGHDHLDALVATLTAHLQARGYAEALGDADEGLIFLPYFTE
ncbi:MAG TPA: DUF429 domain-containing protein [Dehalococcoidia bacterium]|nr:DUF429 domain-containing protein [Dehalococcoidia bacterium]